MASVAVAVGSIAMDVCLVIRSWRPVFSGFQEAGPLGPPSLASSLQLFTVSSKKRLFQVGDRRYDFMTLQK
jgi:hypothetical protein